MQEEEKRNKKMGPNILLAFFYKYRKCHNSQLQIGRVTCVNHTSWLNRKSYFVKNKKKYTHRIYWKLNT